MQTEAEMVWAAKQAPPAGREAALETLMLLAFHAKSQKVQNCAAEALLDMGVHVLGDFDLRHPIEVDHTRR